MSTFGDKLKSGAAAAYRGDQAMRDRLSRDVEAMPAEVRDKYRELLAAGSGVELDRFRWSLVDNLGVEGSRARGVAYAVIHSVLGRAG